LDWFEDGELVAAAAWPDRRGGVCVADAVRSAPGGNSTGATVVGSVVPGSTWLTAGWPCWSSVGPEKWGRDRCVLRVLIGEHAPPAPANRVTASAAAIRVRRSNVIPQPGLSAEILPGDAYVVIIDTPVLIVDTTVPVVYLLLQAETEGIGVRQ
jgi:hypothetical protein